MMCTVQRHGVSNIFNVGPRLMLFDGMSGISRYTDPKRVYLIASDGRLLEHSSEGVISLIDPNITQGGNAKVCGRLIVFATL